jgi:hypothetical protein
MVNLPQLRVDRVTGFSNQKGIGQRDLIEDLILALLQKVVILQSIFH